MLKFVINYLIFIIIYFNLIIFLLLFNIFLKYGTIPSIYSRELENNYYKYHYY
jgi:hypothetical protein